jgi:hypothetical protein
MKGHENKKIYPIPITDHGHGEKHRHLGAGYLFSFINKMCIYNVYEPV